MTDYQQITITDLDPLGLTDLSGSQREDIAIALNWAAALYLYRKKADEFDQEYAKIYTRIIKRYQDNLADYKKLKDESPEGMGDWTEAFIKEDQRSLDLLNIDSRARFEKRATKQTIAMLYDYIFHAIRPSLNLSKYGENRSSGEINGDFFNLCDLFLERAGSNINPSTLKGYIRESIKELSNQPPLEPKYSPPTNMPE